MKAVFLAATVALFPQDTAQEVSVAPVFGRDALLACAINFVAAQPDTAYSGGRPVGVDASFNFYHFGEGRLSAMIKAGLFLDGAMQAPAQSYLITEFTTNSADVVASTPSDDDQRYTLTPIRIGDATAHALGNLAATGHLTVAVVPPSGLTAIAFEIELDAEQAERWNNCMDRLLSEARVALGEG